MKVVKICNMCRKTAIQIKNDDGKTVSTNEIYIDQWGCERNFCKDCMNKKGNRQTWKY